jgi:hypothetical protein
MRRREFITFLGSVAATWQLAGRAGADTPVIGYLNGGAPSGSFASFWRLSARD